MAISPEKLALDALEKALEGVMNAAGAASSPTAMKRIRDGLTAHAAMLDQAREAADPIRVPRVTFDPSDPKTVGRMVSIALLAQPLIPLSAVRKTYGSGVYAIYYRGDHPLYSAIKNTETPIYVGKADPKNHDASNSREQGDKLSGRLIEHAGTISTVEAYADQGNLSAGLHPIRLADFACRQLVCATNAQLAAEKHLIATFWPAWNQETKACWGMSKHGDAAGTRKNKRSPWDVVHPGRPWALDPALVDKLSLAEIETKIAATLTKTPPRKDHATLLEEMLAAFRQDTVTPSLLDELEPPVGADAVGPDDDEAGEED